MVNNCDTNQWSSWKVPYTFVWNAVNFAYILTNVLIFVHHRVFIFRGIVRLPLRVELELQPPPAVHDFRLTGHVV